MKEVALSPAPPPTTAAERVHAALAQWTASISPASLQLAWGDWAAHLAASPGKRLELLHLGLRQLPELANHVPVNLYKANVQLWMNMGLLLQEARQQWADLGDKTLGDDVAGIRKEMEELAQVNDWKNLTDLPGSTAWRRMQKRAGDVQACTETAIAEQTRFVAGIQHALVNWQKSVTHAFNEAGKSLPVAMPMQGAVPGFGALMAMFTPAAGKAGAKPAGKGKIHAD